MQGARLRREAWPGGSPNNAQCPAVMALFIRRAYPLGSNQKTNPLEGLQQRGFGEETGFQVTNELREDEGVQLQDQQEQEVPMAPSWKVPSWVGSPRDREPRSWSHTPEV